MPSSALFISVADAAYFEGLTGNDALRRNSPKGKINPLPHQHKQKNDQLTKAFSYPFLQCQIP